MSERPRQIILNLRVDGYRLYQDQIELIASSAQIVMIKCYAIAVGLYSSMLGNSLADNTNIDLRDAADVLKAVKIDVADESTVTAGQLLRSSNKRSVKCCSMETSPSKIVLASI
jgi:hypothetical protein